MAPLRIGYLHLGAPQHGVRRYGALLAAEARRHEELATTEAQTVLTGDPERDGTLLAEAGHRLSATDVVHLQYTPKIWGGRRDQLQHLRTFSRHCEAPLVATVHDVYPQSSGKMNWRRRASTLRRRVSGRMRRLRATAADRHEDDPSGRIAAAAAKAAARELDPVSTAALYFLLDNVNATLVSSRVEATRLAQPAGARIGIVPHFVEERELGLDRSQARAALRLRGNATITVLGFIQPRKGHHLVVEALAELGPEVEAVFAGRATTDASAYVQDLVALAEARGVRDRLRVTGYLPDEVLDQYLAATDLAVCPFLACSASGSLSSWISVGRPILASDLPQIAEYNALEPGAIDVFGPLTPTALAKAIRERLSGHPRLGNAAVSRLARRLALSKVFEEHLRWYRSAAAAGSQGSRAKRAKFISDKERLMVDSDAAVG